MPEPFPIAAPDEAMALALRRIAASEASGHGSDMAGLGFDQVVVNMGPQHPSTHGVLRLVVTLDGELIKDVIPVIGYLHRSKEKIAEKRTYFQYIPIVDRTEYVAGMNCEWGYVMTVEKLAGIRPTRRAEFIRIDHGRAQPHRQPPGRRRHVHRRPRAPGHGPRVLRLPPPRADPRPLRVGQRRAHDVQLLPLRRRALRPARRLGREVPRAHGPGARLVRRVRVARQRQRRLPAALHGQGRHDPGRRGRLRHHRSQRARLGRGARPAPHAALLGLPRARLQGLPGRARRRARPLPGAGRRDPRVGQDRAAVRSTCWRPARCSSARCARPTSSRRRPAPATQARRTRAASTAPTS